MDGRRWSIVRSGRWRSIARSGRGWSIVRRGGWWSIVRSGRGWSIVRSGGPLLELVVGSPL